MSFFPTLHLLGHIPTLPSCPDPRLTLSTWPLVDLWLRGGEGQLRGQGRWTLQGLEPTGTPRIGH